MRRRQWSRSCSGKKRRKRKLCLDRLYFLYLFCAFLCPRENGALSVSSLERMAGTTRLELATSADRHSGSSWHTQNQQVRCAVVGNRWHRRAGQGSFCSTFCSTPRVR